MNIQHIFDTNRRRVIEAFQSSQGPEKSGRWRKGPQHGLTPAEEDYREAQDWFMEEIRRQLLSAKYNYRLTIPQFYKGRVQLLLPLCLQGEPVLAATLSKESEHLEPSPKGDRETKFVYKLSTVLRISWAYNNARLLGRIESNWLIPELANKEPGHDLVDASGEDYSS